MFQQLPSGRPADNPAFAHDPTICGRNCVLQDQEPSSLRSKLRATRPPFTSLWLGRGPKVGQIPGFIPKHIAILPYNLDIALTLSTRSRRDLKHDTLVLASACVSCAKNISIFVHGYAAIRLRAFAAADEVVKVGKGPAALSRN